MGRYDKYFMFETPPNPIHPESADEDSFKMPQLMTLYINDELNQTVPGAYYMETNIVVRPSEIKDPMDKNGAKPHNHDFNEYMLFLGIDHKNPHDLGGKVEFWVDDEPYFIEKTCAVLIPKLVYHCPIIFHSVDRPFIWITSGDTLRYNAESYSPNPMWKDYQEQPVEVQMRLPSWMRMKEYRDK